MFQKSLNINIFLLKLVGAWPRNYCNNFLNIAYLTFIVCFFLIPVSCFPLLHIYLNENTDLIKISQTAFMSCELTLIAPKLIHLLFHHQKLRPMVSYWDTHIFYTTDAPLKTNKITLEVAKKVRKLTTWFTLLCAFGAITWATKPFQNLSSRTLPADIWLPFDPFKNDVLYSLTFLHSSIGKSLSSKLYFCITIFFLACLLCALSNATIDTTLCNLLLHAAAQIQILKEALRNLGQNENDTKDGLKKCVLHYAAIVK